MPASTRERARSLRVVALTNRHPRLRCPPYRSKSNRALRTVCHRSPPSSPIYPTFPNDNLPITPNHSQKQKKKKTFPKKRNLSPTAYHKLQRYSSPRTRLPQPIDNPHHPQSPTVRVSSHNPLHSSTVDPTNQMIQICFNPRTDTTALTKRKANSTMQTLA